MIKLVIFDLDDTLVDTSSFKEHREGRNWGELDNYIEQFSVMYDAKEAINILRSKGIKIAILTSSRKDYAEKVLRHFDLEYDVIYGSAELGKKKHDYTSLKTGAICELRKMYSCASDEVIFVGDTDKDYKACVESNCLFITHPTSEAYVSFDGTLFTVESYNELVAIAVSGRGTVKVFQNTHKNFGDYISFASYLTDTSKQIDPEKEERYSFDAMHKRILEVKYNGPKSLMNWIPFLREIDLSKYIIDVDYVTRVLGSKEKEIDETIITARDLVAFYFAHKLKAKYVMNILTKSKENDKLAESGLDYKGRKALLYGSYTAKNIEGKSVLVFDDIITTGASMEEAKRAILEEHEDNEVYFCSIGFSEKYTDEKYRQNIANTQYFYCGTKQPNFTIYHELLTVYLIEVLEKKEYLAHNEIAMYGLFDVRGMTLLGNENRKFIYLYKRLKDDYIQLKYFKTVEEMKRHNFHYYAREHMKKVLEEI